MVIGDGNKGKGKTKVKIKSKVKGKGSGQECPLYTCLRGVASPVGYLF